VEGNEVSFFCCRLKSLKGPNINKTQLKAVSFILPDSSDNPERELCVCVGGAAVGDMLECAVPQVSWCRAPNLRVCSGM